MVRKRLSVRALEVVREGGTDDEMLDEMRPLGLPWVVAAKTHRRKGEERDVSAFWEVDDDDTHAVGKGANDRLGAAAMVAPGYEQSESERPTGRFHTRGLNKGEIKRKDAARHCGFGGAISSILSP